MMSDGQPAEPENPFSDPRNRLILTVIGLAQGIVYWLAYEYWPGSISAQPLVVALLFLVSVTALILHLGWTGRDGGRLARIALAAGLISAAVAYWVWQQIPGPTALYYGDDARAATWIAGSAIALYLALPFIQIYQRTGRMAFPYRDLFLHSWNNVFILQLGSLLAGVYLLLIQLWVQLFKLIGISLFDEIFNHAAFISLTVSMVAAYGITIGRDNERIITTLRRIALALFKALMPLLALIALLFLGTLPFTGLAPLWSTRHASEILLALLALGILFFNALFEDGESSLPPWFRLGLDALVLSLPAYSLLAGYSVSLRIGQYGVTPERFFAMLLAVVLGLYAVCYAVNVLRRTQPWMHGVRTGNVVLAWVVMALAVLIHTPAMDPLRWSARSQYQKLAEGNIPAAKFDFFFLRYHLGHAGFARLAQLEQLIAHPEAARIRERIATIRASQNRFDRLRPDAPQLSDSSFVATASTVPIPAELLEVINQDLDLDAATECARTRRCVAIPIDLDGDRANEFIVVPTGPAWGPLISFGRDSVGKWRRIGVLTPEGNSPDRAALLDSLRHVRPATLAPRYQDLRIGSWIYKFR